VQTAAKMADFRAGFLCSASLADATHLVTAFRIGLKEVGFVEGQNVAVEYRSARDQPDQLPVLAIDLIRQQVAVIVGNSVSALVVKAATTTVPIVFVSGGDPVAHGLVASLSLGPQPSKEPELIMRLARASHASSSKSTF